MRYIIRSGGKEETSRFQREREVVLQQLRDRLKQMRVKAPRRPRAEDGSKLDPLLPPDVTAITDEELGRLQGEFALMAQYAQFQVALRSIEHAIAKRGDRFTRARVRMEKTGAQADKAAKVEVDPRTRAISFELLVGESQETLTEAVLQGFVIGRDLCSREQTRRMGTYGGGRQ